MLDASHEFKYELRWHAGALGSYQFWAGTLCSQPAALLEDLEQW